MKTTIASIFFSICCLQTLFSQNLKHLYDLDGNLLFYHMHDTTYYAEFMETTDSATICNINLQCAAFADIDTIADRMFRYNIPYNSISVFNQLMVGNEHLKFCRNEFSPIQSTDIIWPTNKILVKIKSTENIDSIISQSGINIVLTTQMSYDTMVYAISIFDTNDVFEYANRIFETNKVVYSQPSCYNVIHKCSYEDNPRFEDQWYLQQYPDTIFPSDIPEIIIDMVPAWNLTCGSPDVKIAIIDDGIDSYHEDLADNIYSMNDFTDNPQSPFGQCGSFDSHGTQCAGVACAVDNTVGIIGVASKSKVAVLRSMYNTYINNRKMTICNDEWLIQALYNAVNTINAQIVSCSWRRSYSSVLTEAINNLAQAGRCGKGTIFVFSAGNYEFPNDSFSVGFPASLQNTISVGSICENGLRVGANGTFPTFPYWESCYGNGLDLSAPGVSIMTTNPNNSYNGEFQGTSASAPQVSGVAALMLSLDSTLTRQEVYEILCSTASKVALDSNRYMANPLHPYGVWSNQVGYGLVNAHHALLKTLYKDYYISGPDTINLCEQTSYTLYGTRPFNDSITNCWTSSSNIDIISMEDSIVVRGNLFGDGWIAFNIIHDGDSLPIIYPIYVNAVVPIVKDSIFNTNTTINDEILFVGDLIVSATLTITDTVLMAPSARLIVRPGGKLIVNGGTLTSACDGEMWQGIIVEGNANLPQYAQLQGSVILNNATVENARNAISTHTADSAIWIGTGGIVQATNTLFRNNLCSMEMSLYENRNVAGDTIDNTSHFNNCTFRIDTANLFPANNCTFVQHVSLWGVRGVKFNGCTFQNQDTTHSYVNRGRALYTADAGYRCRRICPVVSDTDPCACQPSGSQPVVRCSFTGFYKAIESTGDCGQGSIVIDNCDFANNFVGIVLNASDNAQVSYNHFNLDFSQERNSGLRLVGSTGFTVEDNDFVRMLTTQDTIYGIICDNTGNAENFIRRNDFSNLFYGCYSLKNNGPIANRPRGLQFNCNSYTANTYDIYVPANSTIRNVQGSSNKGADNDFSNTLTRSLTIPMTMNTLSYYYSSGNSHIPVGTSNYTGYGTATANPCASTLCGLQNPGFPPGIIRYASLSEEYELLSDKFERRGYGAILSDRGHYTDSEVQDAMVAESRLDSLSVEMAELSNRGIKAVIQDSVMDFSQLKDWFGAVNTLSAKYLLIETYYKTGDYGAANQLLSALPDMFDMSEGEQEEYENYRAFHALRNTLAGDPVLSGGASVRRNWAELSELELAELQRIAESTSGRTATMAQGILCFFYHICYEDDMALNLGDIGKRSLGGDAQDRRTRCVPTDNGLAIYPNPADGTLTVESASPIREITVYDLSGRVMMTEGGNGTASVETTHALSLRQDINVSSLPAGIYLLRVVTEKGVETGRFVKN